MVLHGKYSLKTLPLHLFIGILCFAFSFIAMTNLMKLRSDYKDAFVEKHGVKLGLMSGFVKEHPYRLLEVLNKQLYLDGGAAFNLRQIRTTMHTADGGAAFSFCFRYCARRSRSGCAMLECTGEKTDRDHASGNKIMHMEIFAIMIIRAKSNCSHVNCT